MFRMPIYGTPSLEFVPTAHIEISRYLYIGIYGTTILTDECCVSLFNAINHNVEVLKHKYK